MKPSLHFRDFLFFSSVAQQTNISLVNYPPVSSTDDDDDEDGEKNGQDKVRALHGSVIDVVKNIYFVILMHALLIFSGGR